MEELEEAPSSSSKMDQQDATETTPESQDGCFELPLQLQSITPAEEFINVRHRWNTNEVKIFFIRMRPFIFLFGM